MSNVINFNDSKRTILLHKIQKLEKKRLKTLSKVYLARAKLVLMDGDFNFDRCKILLKKSEESNKQVVNSHIGDFYDCR